MVSVNRISAEQLTGYIRHLIASNENDTFTDVDLDEIKKYFRIWNNDDFLMMKCSGDASNFEKEMSYIKFPEKSFGRLLIIRGGRDLAISKIAGLHAEFSCMFSVDEWYPLLTWFMDTADGEFEIILISKIFDSENIFETNNFASLWDAIIADMDSESEKVHFDSLRKVNCSVKKNVLELQTDGDSRNSFIISLKKQDIEKSIYKYTGRRLFVEIK